MRQVCLAIALLAGLQATGWEAERTKALELRLANRTADAVTVLDAATRRWPDQADVHYELADAMLEQVYGSAVTGAPLPDRTARLERAATHLRRAMALDRQYYQVGLLKLIQVYDEDTLNRPAEVEAAARQLAALDRSSPVWPIKVANSLAAQKRCADGARGLVAARASVGADGQMLLGMTMPDYLLKCEDLPLAEARPLLETAERIASEALKRTPDDRDVVMLQAAALTALASRLPDGPEKQAVEARGKASFERFMALNPGRQSALKGEAPERVYDGFSYLNEFLSGGKTADAARLLDSMRERHADSTEFWHTALFHHGQRGERADAIAAAQRLSQLSPSDPMPWVTLAGFHMNWAASAGISAAQRKAEFAAAQTALDKALALAPGDQAATYARAQLLQEQAESETDAARKKALLKESAAWKAKVQAPPR